MRNRHIPRVCRHCHAPMASGAAECWRCGVQWASEEGPAAPPRLVIRRASGDEARSDHERWTNEGGTFRSDVAMPRRVAARR